MALEVPDTAPTQDARVNRRAGCALAALIVVFLAAVAFHEPLAFFWNLFFGSGWSFG